MVGLCKISIRAHQFGRPIHYKNATQPMRRAKWLVDLHSFRGICRAKYWQASSHQVVQNDPPIRTRQAMCQSDHAPQPNIPLLLGTAFTFHSASQNNLWEISIKTQGWFVLKPAKSSFKYPQVIPKKDLSCDTYCRGEIHIWRRFKINLFILVNS